jgi:excisionase family DNA binding protein
MLGVGMRRVGQIVAKGDLTKGPRWQHRQLSRAEVEQLALRRWNPRKAGPDSYWLGTKEAAELLGVNRARVRQLVAAGLLPFEHTQHGHAFRRERSQWRTLDAPGSTPTAHVPTLLAYPSRPGQVLHNGAWVAGWLGPIDATPAVGLGWCATARPPAPSTCSGGQPSSYGRAVPTTLRLRPLGADYRSTCSTSEG